MGTWLPGDPGTAGAGGATRVPRLARPSSSQGAHASSPSGSAAKL
jgi:hypothetical protein